MKLNNKGFAFSTMLYGTLALITVVLYAILSISQSSSDTTYYYGETIEAKLNECINDEIALENCYTSGNTTCDATSYHACLGINDHAPVTSDTLIYDKLKTFVGAADSGLVADANIENRYVYTGNNPKNYIMYSGKKWRIVSVEPEGTVRLIDYSIDMNEQWDRTGEDLWNNSSLKAYLTNEYMSTLLDSSKLTSGKWNATIIYPSKSSGNLTLTELATQDTEQDLEASIFSQVGMLTVGDYMKATTVNNCKNNILTATGCSSWLSNYKGWTLNINGEQGNDVEDEEEKINVAYFFDTGDKISQDNTSAVHKVYPIIVLTRNSIINSGDGTESNPYVLR